MVYAGVFRGAKRENVLASQVRIRAALCMAIWIAGAAFSMVLGNFSKESQVAGTMAMTSHDSERRVLKHIH
jgi:hypothetical protein